MQLLQKLKTEKALSESGIKQYLEGFKRRPENNPRPALETCDLHLYQKQPFKYVDPLGNPQEEITWKEPKDIMLYWAQFEKIAWALVLIASFIMFLIVYYFWWA